MAKIGYTRWYEAIIGYPSFQRPKQPQDATSLANAGHYPTLVTFSPGVPDFGYSTCEGYPILMPPTRYVKVQLRPFPILVFILVISASFFGRAYASKRHFCLSHMLNLGQICSHLKCANYAFFSFFARAISARFLLDFCSFARFLLAVCSTCALQRSWPWCVVWHSVHNFTVSCVWCSTGPHAFGPKNIYFGHKILMKQPHDCSY